MFIMTTDDILINLNQYARVEVEKTRLIAIPSKSEYEGYTLNCIVIAEYQNKEEAVTALRSLFSSIKDGSSAWNA